MFAMSRTDIIEFCKPLVDAHYFGNMMHASIERCDAVCSMTQDCQYQITEGIS